MTRSTLPLAVLLLAGLLFAVAAPTASAQSGADCPNTVRAVNGCDNYVPARVAPADPHAEAAAARLADPASRARATQSARQATGALPADEAPAAPAIHHRGRSLTYYTTRTACTAANPGLPTEDFSEANLSSGDSGTMTSPLNASTNNDLFQPGDILPGLSVEAVGPFSGNFDALFVIKDGAHTGVFVGTNHDDDDTRLAFGSGIAAACIDYYNPGGSTPLTIEVYDTSGGLLGSMGGTGSTARSFFGVSSSSAPIGAIVFVTPVGSSNWTNVSNVSFGGGAGPGAKRVLYAPSEADDPTYRAAVAAALGAGAVVDYFDARVATPTVAHMQRYDAVHTWANFAYDDRVAFGDNLAAYADAGGIVVLGVFTSYDPGSSLGGAIRGPAYSPVANPTGSNHFTTDSWDGSGTQFYAGVASLECTFRDVLTTQGAGAVDGRYLDTEILGAYRTDAQKVMYQNGEGHSSLGCSGDWARMLANMVLWANGGGPSCDLKYLSADLVYNSSTRRLCARVTVRNNGTAPRQARLELDYNRNGGAPMGTRVLGTGTLPGGAQATREICLRVPGGTPAGNYNFDLRLVDVATGSDCGSYTETIPIPAPRLAGDVVASGEVFGVEGVADFTPEASAAAGTVGVAPNPFAGQASIAFEVAEAAPVRLAVYDVLGREVAVLVDGHVEVGAHSAVFDARGLSAGTYVYRLVVGADVQTGRMTLAH